MCECSLTSKLSDRHPDPSVASTTHGRTTTTLRRTPGRVPVRCSALVRPRHLVLVKNVSHILSSCLAILPSAERLLKSKNIVNPSGEFKPTHAPVATRPSDRTPRKCKTGNSPHFVFLTTTSFTPPASSCSFRMSSTVNLSRPDCITPLLIVTTNIGPA